LVSKLRFKPETFGVKCRSAAKSVSVRLIKMSVYTVELMELKFHTLLTLKLEMKTVQALGAVKLKKEISWLNGNWNG
jgi:hypothetical protein